MNISEKRYPYPVLTPEGDDYDKKSVFDVEVVVTKDDEKVTFKFRPLLSDAKLRYLINVKRAKITCHVEAPKTVYRKCFDLKLPSSDKAIDEEVKIEEVSAADLSGTVSICPFIVATEDIVGYQNDAFNPDYEGEAFDIESGAVMAEGRQRTFVVDTAKEALKATASIFVVVPTERQEVKSLVMDWSGDRIVITMPKKSYQRYGTLKESAENKEILWAIIFIPALVNVLAHLSQMRSDGSDSLSEYREKRWFRAIDYALRQYCNCGIDNPDFENIDCLMAASVIVKNAPIEAMKKLYNLEDRED